MSADSFGLGGAGAGVSTTVAALILRSDPATEGMQMEMDRTTKEFTTDTAAAKLGISPSQFRRIATARGYEPSRIEEWRYRSRSGTRHLWSPRTVAVIRRTKDYVRTVERVVQRRQKLDALLAKWAREQEERTQLERAVIDDVVQLPLDEHLRLALECLHAANRAAKHAAHAHERFRIYGAKDALLAAMIRSNRAAVATFEIEQASRRQICVECGHEWVGDSYCYSCDDHTGEAGRERRRWYLVDCGSGYRFHQPNLDPALAARAVPIEPHDPTQEPRAVPSVRLGAGRTLDLEMQVKVVLSAAERLAAEWNGARVAGPEMRAQQ